MARYLNELVRHISVLEADGLQEAVEVKALKEHTNQQAMTIHSLQTQVEQLEILARTQSSVGMATF